MKGDVRKRFSVKRLALLLCALGMALALFRSSKPVAAQQTFPSVPFGQLGQTGSWQLLMQDGFSSPLLGGSSYVRDAAGQMVQKPIWVTCAWHTYTALQSTPDEGCTHMRPIVDTDEDQIHLPRNVLPGRPVPWAADGLALQLRLVREDHTPSIGRYAGRTFHWTGGMVSTGGYAGVEPAGFYCPAGVVCAYEARLQRITGEGVATLSRNDGYGTDYAAWAIPADPYSDWQKPESDFYEFDGEEALESHDVAWNWLNSNGVRKYKIVHHTLAAPTEPHWFATVMEPGVVIWYVDGVEIGRFAQEQVATRNMFVQFTMGAFHPDERTVSPIYFTIDEVRAWQLLP